MADQNEGSDNVTPIKDWRLNKATEAADRAREDATRIIEERKKHGGSTELRGDN